MNKIKLLLVDDSAFIRNTFERVLKETFLSSIEVDKARNGKEAVNKVLASNYDIILMDIEMPELNGIEAVKQIMKQKPLPIIMFSSLTQEGASATVKSLRAGAVDFIYKPKGKVLVEMARLRKELKEKITSILHNKKLDTSFKSHRDKIITKDELKTNHKQERVQNIRHLSYNTRKESAKGKILSKDYKVVVIGISTGGPAALEKLFKSFKEDFPLPILVVQHIPAKFVKYLVEQLNAVSRLNVVLAENGKRLKANHVYFSPGDYHLKLSPGNKIRLSDSPPINKFKPSVDALFESAALTYKDKVIAVIMTGMGKDGLEGCKLLKRFNSFVIAQDKNTSVVWGMPRVVVENNLADLVLPLDEIYLYLKKLVKG